MFIVHSQPLGFCSSAGRLYPEARIVDEDVQSAEFLFHFIEQAVQVIQVANVRFHQQSAATQLFDLARGLFGGSAVAEEVDNHVCAVLGEVQGNRASDPAPGAGDQSNFVLKDP